ncbi:hypothetical protein AK812_SmicGene20649 [Symbiodinium microadriaticum]|uniref:Uncharacterized protein n=1 Tax=Symbiodinium microadriaticum TaxID=2951 RepID=A0A1Q9DPF6_SYMMI|nr:hypothetical protein AK812_SmicGene20649 [Symbiodinium microadriaticum]
MVKNLRVKKKTPAWIVAARNSGSTTLQDAQLLFKIRDATPELGSGKGERDSRGQTAVYFAAARKEALTAPVNWVYHSFVEDLLINDPSAEEICRFLLRHMAPRLSFLENGS